MRTTRTSLIVILLTLGVWVSAASAGAPMGPPVAVLGEGQWSLGGEFAHEQIDLQGTGRFRSIYLFPEGTEIFDFVERQRLQDVEMNMFFATVAYGVCDNWDLFVRVGAADAQDDIVGRSGAVADGVVGDYSLGQLDSSYGLAWGVGTRATFCRSGPWSFGGLAQVTWFEPDDSDIAYVDPIIPPAEGDFIHVGEASIDFWQTQISLAVAYEMEAFRVWGGPFLQFIQGDFERSGSILTGVGGEYINFGDTFRASGDIQEESQAGGFFGASWDIAEQWTLRGEAQITGDSWLVGVGATFIPESFGM